MVCSLMRTMTRPIPPAAVVLAPISFAAKRIRLRPLGFLALTLAVASATGLIGWSSLAAALSQEDNVQVGLGNLPPAQRAVEAVSFYPPGEIPSASRQARELFDSLADVVEPPHRLLIGHPVAPSNDSGVRIVVDAQPRRDIALSEGRYPTACHEQICEAVAVHGQFRLGQRVALDANLSAVVVGFAAIQPSALADRSQLGRRALVVASLDRPVRALFDRYGANAIATAPLAVENVHGYAVPRLTRRLHEGLVRLERSNVPGASIQRATAPTAVLERLAERGKVSAQRLLLVAGQAAALVFAFAAFAVDARRREIERSDEQLATFGASSSQRILARASEAVAPSLLGAALGAIGVYGAGVVIAERRGLPDAFLGTAVPRATFGAMAGAAFVACVLLLFSTTPHRRERFSFGPFELSAVVALIAVAWQTASTGGLDSAGLARNDSGPLLVIVPALAFFAVAVALLRVIPFVLRLAERASRHSPPAVRLSFLTAARSPTITATTTTFLAICLGSALFSLSYRATLLQQAQDEARFRSGALWRVVERGRPGGQGVVAPLTRYAAVSDENPTPVLRFRATIVDPLTQDQRPLELIGLPAAKLPQVTGFRDDFSAATPRVIAGGLSPRGTHLSGPLLAGDARAVRIWARSETPYPRLVVMHLLLPGQQFADLRLGTAGRSWRRLEASLPARDRGAELVGIEFVATTIPQGFDYDNAGYVDVGRLSQRRGRRWATASSLGGFVPAEPIDGLAGILNPRTFPDGPDHRGHRFTFNGTRAPMIRPPLELPGALPALLGPLPASRVVDGLVSVSLTGPGVTVTLKPAATSTLFPTAVDHPSSFAVVDYDALFALLNRDRPGSTEPSEAWFFHRQRPGFLAHLSVAPFQLRRAASLDSTHYQLLHDPLGEGTQQLLAVTAAVAAALAVLGLFLAAGSALNVERVVFAEYEALGVPPRTLARSARLRLAIASVAGLIAGLGGGLASLTLIARLVAVTGTATTPLPPIRPITNWLLALYVILAVGGAAILAVSALATRSMAASAGQRLRG
jgi:hypothetical protein